MLIAFDDRSISTTFNLLSIHALFMAGFHATASDAWLHELNSKSRTSLDFFGCGGGDQG